MIEYVCKECLGIFQFEKTAECQLCGADNPVFLSIIKPDEDEDL